MREQYIEMRVRGNYSLEWFFKFYNNEFEEKIQNNIKYTKPIRISFDIFSQLFGHFIQNSQGDVFDYLDKFYNVSKIEGDNNKIIYMN